MKIIILISLLCIPSFQNKIVDVRSYPASTTLLRKYDFSAVTNFDNFFDAISMNPAQVIRDPMNLNQFIVTFDKGYREGKMPFDVNIPQTMKSCSLTFWCKKSQNQTYASLDYMNITAIYVDILTDYLSPFLSDLKSRNVKYSTICKVPIHVVMSQLQHYFLSYNKDCQFLGSVYMSDIWIRKKACYPIPFSEFDNLDYFYPEKENEEEGVYVTYGHDRLWYHKEPQLIESDPEDNY